MVPWHNSSIGGQTRANTVLYRWEIRDLNRDRASQSAFGKSGLGSVRVYARHICRIHGSGHYPFRSWPHLHLQRVHEAFCVGWKAYFRSKPDSTNSWYEIQPLDPDAPLNSVSSADYYIIRSQTTYIDFRSQTTMSTSASWTMSLMFTRNLMIYSTYSSHDRM